MGIVLVVLTPKAFRQEIQATPLNAKSPHCKRYNGTELLSEAQVFDF